MSDHSAVDAARGGRTSPGGEPSTVAWTALLVATQQARQRTARDPWAGADSAWQQVLASSRPEVMVRAHSPHDHVYISSRILIARVRQEIDNSSSWSAVDAITLDAPRQGGLPGLHLDLIASYGVVLLDLAEDARSIVDRVVTELLNAHPGSAGQVVTDITITDVTRTNPHLNHRGDRDY